VSVFTFSFFFFLFFLFFLCSATNCEYTGPETGFLYRQNCAWDRRANSRGKRGGGERGSRLTAHAHGSRLTAHGSLLTAHGSRLTAHCSRFIMCALDIQSADPHPPTHPHTDSDCRAAVCLLSAKGKKEGARLGARKGRRRGFAAADCRETIPPPLLSPLFSDESLRLGDSHPRHSPLPASWGEKANPN
jgi:hypothetical protein